MIGSAFSTWRIAAEKDLEADLQAKKRALPAAGQASTSAALDE
jgi:hypothetical protein